MSGAFVVLAALTIIGAIGAMAFRNPVHCALSLTVTFAALAGLYLYLNAQFVGLVQILVYVGAVAILIVFAILLTRASEVEAGTSVFSSSWPMGVGIALALGVALGSAVLSSSLMKSQPPAATEVTVRDIGSRLLSDYVLPLEVIGLLLTAALIGAVLIAMEDRNTSARVSEQTTTDASE